MEKNKKLAYEIVRAPAVQDEVLTVLRSYSGKHGIEAYLVGGFVRDRLLGKEGKDMDVLVVGDGSVELLAAVAAEFGWSPPVVFDRFGTAQVRGGGFIVEAVRARSEQYDPTSRKPTVKAGTLDDDIWRRDFTINSLCQTFDGEILDRTGRGLDDLRGHVLRTPLDPKETFSEDPLRMLRAARFRAKLGFDLAEGIVGAMREVAWRMTIVSPERIAGELKLLVTSPFPRWGMQTLYDGGVCEVVLPELCQMVAVEQGGYHCYDVWEHTLHAMEYAPSDLITRLAVLFHDSGKPDTHSVADDGKHTFYNHSVVGAEIAEKVLARLRLSNDEIRAISTLVRLHLRPIQYDDSFTDSAVRRLIRDAGNLRKKMMDVARADTKASTYPDMKNLDQLEYRMETLDEAGAISRLTTAIDGNEIMKIVGKGTGPWVGWVKSALADAVINGEITSGDKEAARHWVAAHPEMWSGKEEP